MSVPDGDHKIKIDRRETVLDVISRYRQTEAVFKQYDQKAGACICCEALFEPLENLAQKYGLNLEHLLNDLENAALSL
jgi:hypothetical protein